MSIPGAGNPLLLGGAGGYKIERSLRFNSSDSAYCGRTFSSAGNRKTWTLSWWMKRSKIGGVNEFIWGTGGSNTVAQLYFDSSERLNYGDYTSAPLTTAAVFRDASAWYHCVFSYDTTNATAADRIILYVNGTRALTSSYTAPTQNSDGAWNRAVGHVFGGTAEGGSNSPQPSFNGYLADIHFIDGQALTPSSFGETDINGIWQPKAYSGSYGTNGFQLKFADNSAATATTLGKDTSGNGNNWTPNNLSVTVGTGRYVGATTGSLSSGAWINAFNGSISPVDSTNWAYTYSATTSLTLAEALTGTVEIYATRPGTGNTGTHTITLSTGSSVTLTSAANNNPQWYSFGSQTNVTSITVVGGDPGIAILAVRVNGVILIDKQFGAGNDSLVDTPTSYGTDTGAGGEVRGNYCTLNPLRTNGSGTLSDGNLQQATPTNNNGFRAGTIGVSSGKWYWEVTFSSGQYPVFGLVKDTDPTSNGTVLGFDTTSWGYIGSTGNKVHNSSSTSYGASVSVGDIVGVALDADNGTLTFYKNGVSQGQAFSGLTSGPYYPACSDYNTATSAVMVFNFGQRPFAYTAPSGFKALCTQNLPAPTITKPSTVMDVKLYPGNGSTQTISGLGFSPDLVWIKGRSGATDHALYDSVRGATIDLVSNSTAAETTQTQGLTAFNSDGFSLGTLAKVNTNAATYAGWAFDAGSSTVTNPDGTISSQVRANASAGFSVVTWTGNGASATVGHGLGVAPSFLIVKNRGTTNSWIIYHRALGGAYYLQFDTSTAGGSANATWGSANSDPTASVFSVGSGAATNGNGSIFVAYCFAPVAGYSAFGSYTGNGNADGPFIYTGFRPRWVMIKNTGYAGQSWWILDTARDDYNVTDNYLQANNANAEGTFTVGDILSNGFKIRTTDFALNRSGDSIIFAAFAEAPFALARAR